MPMRLLLSTAVALMGLSMGAGGPASAAASSKPKEIVVVGSKIKPKPATKASPRRGGQHSDFLWSPRR